MADDQRPCCEQTLRQYYRRIALAVTSFPVIRDLPCPVCKRILAVRIYRASDLPEDTV
jgi:hypothetical protein